MTFCVTYDTFPCLLDGLFESLLLQPCAGLERLVMEFRFCRHHDCGVASDLRDTVPSLLFKRRRGYLLQAR